MRKLPVLMFYLFFLGACNSPAGDKKTLPDEKNTQNISQGKGQKLTEGKIDIEITIPGTSLGEIFNSVEPAKGNVQNQLADAVKRSGSKAQSEFKMLRDKNPMMLLNLALLPWKSHIFLKQGNATVKFDALTYHAENTIDEQSGSGTFFICEPANKKQKITFSYRKDELGEVGVQHQIKSEDYNIQKTNVIDNVAGFTCKKSIYTLKDKPTANQPRLASNSLAIAKIEVWSSDQMPSTVNFLNPLYVNEKAGIMKLKVFYSGIEDMAVVYSFKTVEAIKLSSEEMKIQQSSPVYNFSKDAIKIGGQLMGILFKF